MISKKVMRWILVWETRVVSILDSLILRDINFLLGILVYQNYILRKMLNTITTMIEK